MVRKINSICVFIVFAFYSTAVLASEPHYVDLTDSGSSNIGTYAEPFRSMSTVNAHSFVVGDDLYFKVNTTHSMSDKLLIDWAGTEEDRVVIGVYSGDGVFTLGGGTRPILDGNSTVPGYIWDGMIHAFYHDGYITIENLHIKDSAGIGIQIAYSTNSSNTSSLNNVVYNCFVEDSYLDGIILVRNAYSLIEDCEVSNAAEGSESGGGINFLGAFTALSHHNTVRGCTIYDSQEGIGLYQGTQDSIVEDCVAYDNATYFYYVSNGKNNIIRNNLAYSTSTTSNGGGGIVCDNEDLASSHMYNSNNTFYNNYIAGVQNGIVIANIGPNTDPNAEDLNNLLVYENRIVDCAYNYTFYNPSNYATPNNIYDNKSFIFTGGMVHSSAYSPNNITWDSPSGGVGNFFNSAVTGNANDADNPATDAYTLVKTTGWRTLTRAAVTRDDFLLTGEATTTCVGEGYVCCETDSGTTAHPELDSTCGANEYCYESCTVPATISIDTTDKYGGSTYTPSLLYAFNEGTGTNIEDLAGSNDGTAVNPTWSIIGGESFGLSIDAVNKMVTASMPSFPADGFSIVIAFTSTSDSAVRWGKFWWETTFRDFNFERYNDDTTYRFDLNEDSWYPGVKDVFNQKIHVLVVTVDDSANSRCIIIDGVQQSCNTDAFTNPSWTGAWYLFNVDNGTLPLLATIHLFAVYPDVFVASEALELYTNPMRMIENAPTRTFDYEGSSFTAFEDGALLRFGSGAGLMLQ